MKRKGFKNRTLLTLIESFLNKYYKVYIDNIFAFSTFNFFGRSIAKPQNVFMFQQNELLKPVSVP